MLDFAKDKLRKLRGKVQLVTSRQAQYLGTVSVLEGYARAGEVLRGFYALMALWKSVEDLSGDQQLEVGTYRISLRASEESEPTADVAYTNWAAGRFFELQVGFQLVCVVATNQVTGFHGESGYTWIGCMFRISVDRRFTPTHCLFNRASLPRQNLCTNGHRP